MSVPLPEPDDTVTDPVARILAYLDHHRSEVRRLTESLDAEQLERRVAPSGWNLLELVEHLVHMERRWLVWGFLGERVVDPEGDRDADGRFVTTRGLAELLGALDAGGRRTTEIAMTHAPEARSSSDGWFADDTPAPTLLAICFHVLNEYARHLGHLDIVHELLTAD
jgi:uncharacterized damage-inducible protein DinB